MSSKNILSFNNISKMYGNLLALDKVSFKIPENAIYGILGANGSGKSTLMRILGSLILDYSGSIKYKDQLIKSNSKQLISSFGFLIENPSFYEFLTGRQNLEILSRISNVNENKINEILDLVNLNTRSNDKVQTYSYGMKQRLGLAQTLLHEPVILILDEPNNGLDPKGIDDMSNIIRDLQNIGKTIILSTHILSEVEYLCSHFTILKEGKNIATQSMKILLEKSNQYSIQVDNYKLAKNILLKNRNIEVISLNENQINFFSSDTIDLNKLNDIFKGKIIIYQFYKNSGLIEFFND